jgi:hypothetical protein
MQHFFFQVEQDYRAELHKIGREIPAIADVCVDFGMLPAGQHSAIKHLLHSENKFLNYNRSDGVPAHDARTLLMALTREAWCDPLQLGQHWTPSARVIIPTGHNRLLSETPPPYFEPQELRGLHLVYRAHAEPIAELIVDVDERVLLLLMLERAEQLENASLRHGYKLPALLNKLVSLTLPEADTLWTALQTNSSARLVGPAQTDLLYDVPVGLSLPELSKVPVRR